MRLLRAHIERFKGLRELDLDFRDAQGSVRDRLLILGDNGSGKTTLLQAIALTLGIATRHVKDPESFPWYGFIPERMNSLGPTRIELEVGFDDDEILVTRRLYEECKSAIPKEETRGWIPPGESKTVTLQYSRGEVTARQGPAAKMQFLGRYYLKRVQRIKPDLRSDFARVGDVFWFDQFRNLGTLSTDPDLNGIAKPGAWSAGVEQLRSYLVVWWSYHLTRKAWPGSDPGGRDYIHLLQQRMERVFPGFRFVGTEPRKGIEAPGPSDFLVLVEREGCSIPYDIAEMSSGEQAVFPLAYEMTRLEIVKSIVLLDELELHLHPPEQQALYGNLPRLAPDCQFIVTTHSKYLDDIVPETSKMRLKGGRLCL
ncbi:MAG: AAA family ATPase [Firmicutes bacterium]|nr:AAA family ATPase [Bacillota bacterium]